MRASCTGSRPPARAAPRTPPGDRRSRRSPRPLAALLAALAFEQTRDLHARGHVELAEDVAQVGFDRLDGKEQLVGDLLVRLAVRDQLGNLALATREGVDAAALALAARRGSRGPRAQTAQLTPGLGMEAERTSGL